MTKQNIELEVLPSGEIRTIYKDEVVGNLQTFLNAEIRSVQRASNIEWEVSGWTVRAAHDPELAIRYTFYPIPNGAYGNPFVVAREGKIVTFIRRETALEWEQKLFWELLPPKEN